MMMSQVNNAGRRLWDNWAPNNCKIAKNYGNSTHIHIQRQIVIGLEIQMAGEVIAWTPPKIKEIVEN